MTATGIGIGSMPLAPQLDAVAATLLGSMAVAVTSSGACADLRISAMSASTVIDH